MGYNSIMRQKLISEIPKSKDLREAGIKAGYSRVSRNIYSKDTKHYIETKLVEMGYDEESIKKDFKRLQALAEQRKDLSNANRSLENIARIAGHYKDKQELKLSQEVPLNNNVEANIALYEQELAKLKEKQAQVNA